MNLGTKRVKFISVLGWLFLFLSPVFGEVTPLSLQKAYELSVKQSEVLKRSDEEVVLAEAKYKEALAALYPDLLLNASQRFRSSEDYGSSDSSNGDFDDTSGTGGGSVQSGSRGRETHEFQTYFSLTQPIFTGFREYFLSQSYKSEVKARSYDTQRARELLYRDVADVFYQASLYERDIRILENEVKTLRERKEELNHFISIGRSREGEILAVEADLLEVMAVQERSTGTLNATLELLSFLTGLSSNEIKIVEEGSISSPKTLETYLDETEKRFDLLASHERKEAREKELKASQREKWPVITFEGNAYPYEDPDLNREWDALLKFSLPIFDGGAIDSRIQQSRAQLRIQELSLSEGKRLAERDVRVAYANVQASMAEVSALRKLLEATTKNHISQKRDYELGVVTNLEVLSAIRDEQNARRRLLVSEISLKLDQIRLEVAGGGFL